MTPAAGMAFTDTAPPALSTSAAGSARKRHGDIFAAPGSFGAKLPTLSVKSLPE